MKSIGKVPPKGLKLTQMALMRVQKAGFLSIKSGKNPKFVPSKKEPNNGAPLEPSFLNIVNYEYYKTRC